MTGRTERHMPQRAPGGDGEGQKGMPKEGNA
jgi:hypothetical protein